MRLAELSYLNGAAWRMPAWYRTKMPRARKGEYFQKLMMPLQGKDNVTSPAVTHPRSPSRTAWEHPVTAAFSYNATRNCPPCVELLLTPSGACREKGIWESLRT